MSEQEKNKLNDKTTLTDRAAEKIKYSRGYLIYLIIIIGLAHLLDEYTTLAPGMYNTSVFKELLVDPGLMPDLNAAAAFFNTLKILMIVWMMLSNFYKGLMDKFGRRIIFIISATGMVAGVVVMILSFDFTGYFVGYSFIQFFVIADMQYQFINEETPTKHRGQVFSYAKVIGLLGLLIVPLIRTIAVTEEHENWRAILSFPLIIGAIVVISSIFLLKETRAFRIMKEERKINPDAYKEEKLGLKVAWQALKKLPTWNQIKWLLILAMLIIPMILLNQEHTDLFMTQAGYSQSQKNPVLVISMLSVGAMYLIHGLVTDRIGRKPSYLMNAVIVAVLLPIEYFAILDYNFVLAGLAQGLRIGAFWNITDVSRFLLIENVPTRLRGYGLAIMGFMYFIPIFPFFGVSSFIIDSFAFVQVVLIIFGVPTCLAQFFIVLLKIKETKNVDITKIADVVDVKGKSN